MSQTDQQFDQVAAICRDIFTKKMKDYGATWRILRHQSVTDQIFIKAQRIRTLQENGFSRVYEGQIPEFIGIINYCVMALILLSEKNDSDISGKLEKDYIAQID